MRSLAAQLRASPILLGVLRDALATLPRSTIPDVMTDETRAGPDGLRRELEWLALVLVADTTIREAFIPILTSDQLAGIAAAERTLTQRQLRWIRDKAQLDNLGARLAGALDAPSPRPPPSVTPPLDDADALDRYLAAPTRTETTGRGLKKARFVRDVYRPQLDNLLRDRGYDMVVIENPSPRELDELEESEGYFLVTEWVRYVTAARTEQAFLDGLDSKHRSRMKNMLARSTAFRPELGPLRESDFAEWYVIYKAEVLSKPGADEFFHARFAEQEQSQGRLELYHRVFFREPERQSLVGGAIVGDYVERGIFSISGAAYRHDFKQYDLSVRTFVTSLGLALEMGWPLVSYGTDPNFYGYDLAVGLLGYKLSVAVTPFPEGEFAIIKVLDSRKIAAITNHDEKRPGYFFFSVRRGSALWDRVRETCSRGEIAIGHVALGGHYFAPQCLRSADNLVGNYFYGDEGVHLRTPRDIEVIRRAMT